MTNSLRKEIDHRYYIKNKKKILKRNAVYLTRYRQGENWKRYISEYCAYNLKTLRSKLVSLYSAGTNLCTCGASVQELHHTDPKDAKREYKKFGNAYGLSARKYQLEMYNKNPHYLTPLCKKCHVYTHKKLKAKR
jgi:hypothetical protein